MHYSNLVIVKRKGEGINNDFDLEKAVEVAMGPPEDDGGFWDWFQIGGRWTGTFDGYDPMKDPANQKPCDLCGATGKRTDSVAEAYPHLKCNGCDGTGIQTEWPTQWKHHDGDVMPVAHLTEDHLREFYRIVLPNGYGVYARERWLPWREANSMMEEQEMPTLAWIQKMFGAKPQYEEEAEYVAVVVDNHS
jgi:hypothetical protein